MKARLLRGRYEPLEVVGSGGEAEVIHALDRLHDRPVALKVRPVGSDASRSRLLSEARLLLSLSPHSGLPLVREDFFVDGDYVIAMDWIQGTNLETLLEAEGRPGLDPAHAIAYLEQAARALEHLHAHDPPVVHGDVKPANLILTSSERIVLVDFGLSSLPTDDVRRAGTSGYVAPEVAAGAIPTAASDVYALAATVVALLTGTPPGARGSRWGAIDLERIPALERILRPNLATDPTGRPDSPASMVARLRRWWGEALPTGTVALVLADLSDLPSRDAEDSVSRVADARGGQCVAPADDGPLLVAFASAQEAVDAGRELASSFEARVAVATGEAEVGLGSYGGQPVRLVTTLLELTERKQVSMDDATAVAIELSLPRELGLAEMRSPAPLGDASTWVLVSPDLASPSRAHTCPYRGLMAFGAEDGDLFFGREEIIRSVLDRLLDGGFMAVVGASGSGKSSLVRAGLVPAYREARDEPVVVMTPGSNPVAELNGALSGAAPTLLVVDQLEEVFTLCPDEERRARFINALLDLHDGGSSAIVVSLRADYYGRCAAYPRLAAALAEYQHLLGAMQREELRRAIEGPARAAGLRLEDGLVETMLVDVEDEPGALPLLSHALYETWARRDGRVLTTAGYLASGGVRGAIASTAEHLFTNCSPHEQAAMKAMFLRLTELGDATEENRRRVQVAELVPDGRGGGEVTALLDRLAAARLVVLGDDSVEIAHEALIREWPRLRRWLVEDREDLQTLRQLTVAARTWKDTGRHDADLYRGPRLAAASELAGDERRLSGLEREFLAASQDAQTRALQDARRRARRLRGLLAAVAAALLVAVVAGSFAAVQRGRARRSATVAQAGRLAAQSRETAAQHPDLALLLALEAGRLDDSVDSRGALLGALEHASHIRAWLQGFSSPVNASSFSPDGRLLATVTHGGTALWDTSTWRPDGPPLRSSQGNWEGVDFSPDGQTLAIAGGKGRVELWDVSTRKELRELTDPGAAPKLRGLAVVRFSPNGRIIAAGSQQTNHVTLWDAGTGRVLGRPIITNPPGTGAQAISFSPDSKRIAVPGATGTVGIWDVATGQRIGKPLTVGSADVDDAIFARDGRALIAGDDSGSVSVTDIATRRRLGPSRSVGDHPATALDLSPDERLLAAATYDGPVFVWDLTTSDRRATPLTADTTPGNGVVFSPDGRTLVSSHLRSAVVWSMNGEQAIGEPVGGAGDLTSDVSFSPDGKRLAAGLVDGSVVLYDAATRRRVRRLKLGSIVTAVAFAPDGKLLAAGTIDGRAQLFDAMSGTRVGPALGLAKAAVWQVAFSPDGKLLAVAIDRNGVAGFDAQRRQGEVQLWDVGSWRRAGPAIVPRAGSILSLAINREGTLLATGGYHRRLDLWDVASHSRLGEPMNVADDGFGSVAFDPSGRLVAGGGASGLVRVWRVADQRLAFPALTGHTGGVTGASFDPAGSFLATTSMLGGTRLWDAATGLPYGDELVGDTRPTSLLPPDTLPFLGLRSAFSPDGEQLAVGGLATRAMLWDVNPAVWRRRACAIAGRNLRRVEWSLYLPPGTSYRATCPEWPAG